MSFFDMCLMASGLYLRLTLLIIASVSNNQMHFQQIEYKGMSSILRQIKFE